MKLQRIILLTLTMLLVAPLAAVLAHGGTYRGPRIPSIPSIPTKPPPGRFAPPGGGGTPGLDVRRWEDWWAFNKDEFFPVRGVPLTKEQDPDYDRSNRLPTRREVRELIIPVLIKGLGHKDKEIRNSIAVALGRVGEEPELVHLKKLLKDRDRSVIEGAIIGLGLLKCTPAEDVLINLSKDTKLPARQRGLAMMALGLSAGESAREYLTVKLGKRRTGPREKVAQMASLQAMAAGLASGSDLPGADKEKANPDAGQLVSSIKKGLVTERFFQPTAYVALAKIGDSTAEKQVLKGLKHKKSEVRAAAAIAVGRVFRKPAAKTMKTLSRILSSEKDRFTRRLLLISLGRIGGPDALAILKKNLRHKDRQHRAFTTLALAISGEKTLVAQFRKALTSERSHSLKGVFAIALGLLEDQGAVPLIKQEIENNKDPELRAHLVQALMLIGDRASADIIEKVMTEAKTPGLQAAAALSLGLLGAKTSMPLLVEMLSKARTISVKGAIATGIGRRGGYRLIESLLQFVRNEHEQDQSRAFGYIALGILGEKNPTLSPFSRVSIDSQYNLRLPVLDELRDLL